MNNKQESPNQGLGKLDSSRLKRETITIWVGSTESLQTDLILSDKGHPSTSSLSLVLMDTPSAKALGNSPLQVYH